MFPSDLQVWIPFSLLEHLSNLVNFRSNLSVFRSRLQNVTIFTNRLQDKLARLCWKVSNWNCASVTCTLELAGWSSSEVDGVNQFHFDRGCWSAPLSSCSHILAVVAPLIVDHLRPHPSINRFTGSSLASLSRHFLCSSNSSVVCPSLATPGTFSFATYLSSPRWHPIARLEHLHRVLRFLPVMYICPTVRAKNRWRRVKNLYTKCSIHKTIKQLRQKAVKLSSAIVKVLPGYVLVGESSI